MANNFENYELKLANKKCLELDKHALIMGIINVTPDSFFPDSRVLSSSNKKLESAIVDKVAAMLLSGMDILDIGGESTRPGSQYVSQDEELARVLPAVEAIRKRWDVPISIDTRKSFVAASSIKAGADIINDISAFEDDDEMAKLCAKLNVPVVLMHKKGIPLSMQDNPKYKDCPSEVFDYLLERADYAQKCGIEKNKIILDPGIGFGKTFGDNINIICHLDDLTSKGYPVLVGLSRKTCIANVSQTENRLFGSLGAACAARSKGAVIFRVHDVMETVSALAAFDAFLGKSQNN